MSRVQFISVTFIVSYDPNEPVTDIEFTPVALAPLKEEPQYRAYNELSRPGVSHYYAAK